MLLRPLSRGASRLTVRGAALGGARLHRPAGAPSPLLRPLSTGPEPSGDEDGSGGDASEAPSLAPYLEAFVDPYEVDPKLPPPGRRWSAAEIRLKSDADLQKLWAVLLRERNMLASVKLLHERRKTTMPHPERARMTRKSMAMIKVVLGERQRSAETAMRRGDLLTKRQRRRQKALAAAEGEHGEAVGAGAAAGAHGG
mmetsp:Transcript_6885/g.22007  ORF Transcript_6885/g.22007 Transcript_6885/m.22007 type:complete len:198 (-) Transcript_6885:225-818(-)